MKVADLQWERTGGDVESRLLLVRLLCLLAVGPHCWHISSVSDSTKLKMLGLSTDPISPWPGLRGFQRFRWRALSFSSQSYYCSVASLYMYCLLQQKITTSWKQNKRSIDDGQTKGNEMWIIYSKDNNYWTLTPSNSSDLWHDFVNSTKTYVRYWLCLDIYFLQLYLSLSLRNPSNRTKNLPQSHNTSFCCLATIQLSVMVQNDDDSSVLNVNLLPTVVCMKDL